MAAGAWHRHSNLPDVAQRYHFDGESMVREKVQDIAPIVDGNAAIRNDLNGRTSGGGQLVGRVPASVFYAWVVQWQREGKCAPGHMGNVNDLMIEKLRDSDFSKFRTADGGI